jgi:uncharacterized membrane protein YfcA
MQFRLKTLFAVTTVAAVVTWLAVTLPVELLTIIGNFFLCAAIFAVLRRLNHSTPRARQTRPRPLFP